MNQSILKEIMNINNRTISRNAKPYIIAELSANHNGSLERAKNQFLKHINQAQTRLRFRLIKQNHDNQSQKDDFL